MSLDQKALFEVVSCAHRNGVLEKLMVLLGEAIEEALEETRDRNLGQFDTNDIVAALRQPE